MVITSEATARRVFGVLYHLFPLAFSLRAALSLEVLEELKKDLQPVYCTADSLDAGD